MTRPDPITTRPNYESQKPSNQGQKPRYTREEKGKWIDHIRPSREAKNLKSPRKISPKMKWMWRPKKKLTQPSSTGLMKAFNTEKGEELSRVTPLSLPEF